jgi:hypothetical protein
MRSLVVVAGFCLTFGAAANAADVPELAGTWNGVGPSVSNEEGWETERSASITIDEQRGRVFRGKVHYEGGEEEFVGIIQADGKSILISNDDGRDDVTLTGPDEMELCYVQGGDDAIATCMLMKRAQ